MEADLTINMDRKCKRCGKPGVAHTKNTEGEGRYCLGCNAKIMEERMTKKAGEPGNLGAREKEKGWPAH
jgi:hypothetical protein